ncbi:MAG: LytS/YhcK type 5TM receptor domain-containing protein, partial [Pseudomonadota bacterium]
MLLAVFDRAALMLICLFFLTRTRLFRQLLQKEDHTPLELAAVTAIFSLFALFSTYSGINVEGSLVNVRVIAIMAGGILFGPWVGIITGIIAGLHRYLIDIDGITSVPCLITSIIAGIGAGYINLKVKKGQRWRAGILGGMLCESLTMLLIVVWAKPTELGLDIVSKIALPMILGTVCIGLIVLLVQSVEDEKEVIAARQAKLALDIARKTLPYFRNINSESLATICEIIRHDINADAVAEYEFNLTNLINDVRAEFNVPDLPFVIANSGMDNDARRPNRRAAARKPGHLTVASIRLRAVGSSVCSASRHGPARSAYWASSTARA